MFILTNHKKAFENPVYIYVYTDCENIGCIEIKYSHENFTVAFS